MLAVDAHPSEFLLQLVTGQDFSDCRGIQRHGGGVGGADAAFGEGSGASQSPDRSTVAG